MQREGGNNEKSLSNVKFWVQIPAPQRGEEPERDSGRGRTVKNRSWRWEETGCGVGKPEALLPAAPNSLFRRATGPLACSPPQATTVQTSLSHSPSSLPGVLLCKDLNS